MMNDYLRQTAKDYDLSYEQVKWIWDHTIYSDDFYKKLEEATDRVITTKGEYHV